MKPRTTGIGEKEQNGDVEAANGAPKRRLKQYLLLRGSRDFASVAAYETWVQATIEKANGLRRKRVTEDQAAMTQVRGGRDAIAPQASCSPTCCAPSCSERLTAIRRQVAPESDAVHDSAPTGSHWAFGTRGGTASARHQSRKPR